jgi:excinuclease UvrABC ATPase subunit
MVYIKTMKKIDSFVRAIKSDLGNSVIVVEHDKDMIEQADYVIDIGPKAGKFGGEITALVHQLKPEIRHYCTHLNGK